MYIEINGWDAGVKFSGCHFIPGHDKCSRLHGHNYGISARVFGEKNEEGMLLDFLPLKDALRKIADELDHRVLIPGDSKEMKIDLGDDVKIEVSGKKYLFPYDDVVVMDIPLASAEELAEFILNRLLQTIKLPDNIKAVEIGVDEGRGQGAWVKKDIAH
jgi:6-pyruvoyltetrahydropterin/6-carboxytetrahydropterin synthase